MTGLTYNLPFDQYARLHGLSASAIKAGRTSMKHMRHAITCGSEPSGAMAKGTLIHALFFDPVFWFNVIVTDEHRSSNAFKAIASANEGKHILKSEQAEELREIEASLKSNKDAVDLLSRCKFEVTAQWERGGLGECKARFDALADDGSFFIDLKTCSDISPRAVGSQFVSMGYDIQYGWYRFGNQDITGKTARVYQINLETSAPYDCTVDEVYSESCEEGLRKAIDIATRYRECERLGVYTGVRDYIAKMTLPEWYKEQLDLSADIPFGEFED